MSQLEKRRALTLVTLLTLSLAGLIAFQHGTPGVGSTRDALELCAASKGAICEEVQGDKHLARGRDVVELGHIVVTATRIYEDAVDPAEPRVAFLGSITVTAPRA